MRLRTFSKFLRLQTELGWDKVHLKAGDEASCCCDLPVLPGAKTQTLELLTPAQALPSLEPFPGCSQAAGEDLYQSHCQGGQGQPT